MLRGNVHQAVRLRAQSWAPTMSIWNSTRRVNGTPERKYRTVETCSLSFSLLIVILTIISIIVIFHDYSYSFHLFVMVTCFETMQFWIDIVRPSGMSPNFFGGMAKTREAWQPDRGFDIAAGRNKWPNLMHCSLFARFSWSLWRPSSNSSVFFGVCQTQRKPEFGIGCHRFFQGKMRREGVGVIHARSADNLHPNLWRVTRCPLYCVVWCLLNKPPSVIHGVHEILQIFLKPRNPEIHGLCGREPEIHAATAVIWCAPLIWGLRKPGKDQWITGHWTIMTYLGWKKMLKLGVYGCFRK